MKFTELQIKQINDRVADLTTRENESAVPATLGPEQLQAIDELVTRFHFRRVKLFDNSRTLKEYSGGKYNE